MSAHDVAREIRKRLGDDVPRKKLHKLLYYCQSWHLTWTKIAIFQERIAAWDMGPVVVELFQDQRHRPDYEPSPLPLSVEQFAIVDYVLERYGHLTGTDLEHLTHQEAPWREADRNETITHDALRTFFEKDEDLARRNLAADRIRVRTDIYSLGPRTLDPAAKAAVDRVLQGNVIDER